MDKHLLKFQRNRETGMWRGWCYCGWSAAGTEEQVKSRAATHDMEWEDMPASAPERADA